MMSDAMHVNLEQTTTIRAALEERFPRPASNPMMQALHDAVLAWLIEREEDHDRCGNTETH